MCWEKSFASHPRATQWNYALNELTPREVFKRSNQKIWFNCIICSTLYNAFVYNIHINGGCIYCNNKTETLLYDSMLVHYPTLERQFKQHWNKNTETGRHMPYDFAIKESKIIIELDGMQHFQQVSSWTPVEITQERDKLKEKLANDNNYSVIRITQLDVWYNRNNWKKELISAIEKVILDKIVQNVYICFKNEYDNWHTNLEIASH
jgi:very-short-patch-repair endonuclease